MLAMRGVLMPATILDLDLNRAMANPEIVLQHMCHFLVNVLTVTYALICHNDVATTGNQA